MVPAGIIAGLLLVVGLVASQPAGAHGVLQRSSPAPNSTPDAAPRQVDLWFTEPVDPAFSSATVVDPFGNRVSGDVTVTADGRQMTVPLRDLPGGFYTVRWRVLSAVDGHTTGGAFVFAVGIPGRGIPARLTAAAGESEAPHPGLVVIRWIGYLAVTLLAGAVLFAALILEPGLRRLDPPQAVRLGPPALVRLRMVQTGAAVVVLASAASEVALRAALVLDVSPGRAIAGGHLAQMLWGTNPGWSALLRAACAALLLLPSSPPGRILRAAGLVWIVVVTIISVMFGGPAGLSQSSHLALVVLVATVYGLASVLAAILLPHVPDLRVPEFRWVHQVAASGALAGLTVASHAWGVGALAVVMDWIHLMAAAVWIGGLACLLVVLLGAPPDRPELSRALVPRFSAAALVCLGLLVVTGAYSAWLHIPGLRAFVTTDYGRALLLKIVLVVPLAGLGALNRFLLRPRIEQMIAGDVAPLLVRFLRIVGGETALAAAVLLVVTVLTVLPPARVTLATRPAASALRMAGSAGEIHLTMLIDPALPGPNRIEVTLTGRDGRPLATDGRVLVRLMKLDEELPPTMVTLEPRTQGVYGARDPVPLPVGWWEAEVLVRRRGMPEASAAVPLRLGQARPAPSEPSAARLLEGARTAMGALGAWREAEQITDGAGGLVVANAELVQPDRLRIWTSGGAEVIIVGATRYLREGGGAWRQETFSRPVASIGVLQYLKDARAVARGRRVPCDGETCQVVLWEAPERQAAFAGWIGTRTHRIHRLLMVAPSHYMTLRVFDFGAAVRIEAPR
ncbi:MAG: copper resistance protein CopC [Armatimonadota bacterium]|nr:copper resistance protein CopC [Armatimonadota bacterium]MDR7519091.1 copper resistance protein CopC [Armatimonadota bacterium]